nr:unnamed protein product [Callosobruchus chinensis]
MPNRKKRNTSHSMNQPYYDSNYESQMQPLPSFYDYPSTSGDFTRTPTSMMYQNQMSVGIVCDQMKRYPNRNYSHRDKRKEFYHHDNRQQTQQFPKDPVSFYQRYNIVA